MSDFSDQVPYELPRSRQEAIAQLSEILDIPMPDLKGDGTSTLQAMCATIMFRHLDRHEEREALKLINSQHPRVAMHLRDRALDPKVNPDWGVWSLKKEELEDLIQQHENFQRFMSVAGINAGYGGVLMGIWRVVKQGASKGNVLILIAGIITTTISEMSSAQLEELRDERLRRLKAANENARY